MFDQIRCKAIFFLSANFIFGMVGVAVAQPVEGTRTEPLVVFLVRHAEKTDAADDPALAPGGKKRAQELARMLRDSGIEHIHSTDYVRTRNTAQPVAEKLKLKVGLYDSRKLPDLVKRLKKAGGRHLVVGHSNTTPPLVKLLGGEPGKPINEAGEYDRIYVVTIDQNQKTSTLLLRYGKPFEKRNRESDKASNSN